MNAYEGPLICCFSHHKCASTWTSKIAEEICLILGMQYDRVKVPEDFEKNLPDFIQGNRTQFLSYSDADIRYVKELSEFRAFHVVRDPRDIVVSAYYCHRYRHPTEDWPELATHRLELEKVSIEQGLFLEMDFLRQQFNEMLSWEYKQPHVMEVKMEQLIQDPLECFTEIVKFLELDKTITSAQLEQVLQKFSFQSMSNGRNPGEIDIYHHYRRGIPGDWENHFLTIHLEYFNENYGALLSKLNYRSDT